MRIRTMEQQVASTFTQQRLIARLTSLFGLLALMLASIALYGLRRTMSAGGQMRSAYAWP
jgi:macrolide transport system ATP-binding/permease protein